MIAHPLGQVLDRHRVGRARPRRVDCTVWGDILTAMASDRGVAGTVIDASGIPAASRSTTATAATPSELSSQLSA